MARRLTHHFSLLKQQNAKAAILIKLKSPGPAFFSHERIGYQGKKIQVWKLRTMHVDAQQLLDTHLDNTPEAQEEWNTYFKLKNDPRIISGIGHFLRKSSMDELPQLWNILKGEMSVVGPRPILEEELERYGANAKYYLALYPGLTGLWQVSGRNNTTYEERVKLDTVYFYEQSFLLDLKIFFRTFYIVLTQYGAC